MNILVINAGSSSLKYQLVDVNTNKVRARGLCERVGSKDSFHKHGIDDNEVVHEQPLVDHVAAMRVVLECLTEGSDAVLSSLSEISFLIRAHPCTLLYRQGTFQEPDPGF